LSKNSKIRLDDLLVAKGLAENKSRARALILSGQVIVNDELSDKAGTPVALDAEVRVKESARFVSRGGLKLEGALTQFGVTVTDFVCVDIGASTGGFTDCLLQHGAKRVYAIDVGYGQMHWKLQSDERVIRFDRENFRNFDATKIPEAIDLCVMDVSFISVKLLLPKLDDLFERQNKDLLAVILVKPQFEVGRELVSKGGIVRDVGAREMALANVVSALQVRHWQEIQTGISPITGADGNVEYVLTAKKKAP
jgi:23S rRNA (cytidine1920-2'-O)/16S rRNA (cytidine1409-2'-O)-methyltransferase